MGNLQEQTLEQAYRSFLEKKSIFTQFDPDQIIACKNCPVFLSCMGGCRARALLYQGDIYGKDPVSCARQGFSV
jgi:radical SAM protein with 4Fe4S-binding SPASM domain